MAHLVISFEVSHVWSAPTDACLRPWQASEIEMLCKVSARELDMIALHVLMRSAHGHAGADRDPHE